MAASSWRQILPCAAAIVPIAVDAVAACSYSEVVSAAADDDDDDGRKRRHHGDVDSPLIWLWFLAACRSVPGGPHGWHTNNLMLIDHAHRIIEVGWILLSSCHVHNCLLIAIGCSIGIGVVVSGLRTPTSDSEGRI